MTGPGLLSAGSSDPGRRPYNEDSFLVDDAAGLYIVADGVGGRQAGEVASQLACDTIAERIGAGDGLPRALEAAHRVVRAAVDAGASANSGGMASTAVVLRINDGEFQLGWAGDSRAYFFDGEHLDGLTRDHSLVERLVDRGEITREQTRDHPQKNIIFSGIGGEVDSIEVSCNGGRLQQSGVFLLCSDGLSDVLPYAEICAILARDTSIGERAAALTDAAHEAGGRDNITAVLVAGPGPLRPVDLRAGGTRIYERFEARSGALFWPEDGNDSSTPTVRRVRARGNGEDGEDGGSADSAAEPRRPAADTGAGPGNLRRGLVIAAAILLAGVLYLMIGSAQ